MTPQNRLYLVAGSLLALLALFVLGAAFYEGKPDPTKSALPLSVSAPQSTAATAAALNRSDVPYQGPIMARVQVTEFFDPACEACRAFYPYVKEILSRQDGKLRLNLRYAAFHEGSDYVIKALEAARMQGSEIYVRALEAVLNAQPDWAEHGRPQPERIWEHLAAVGVDVVRAKGEMNDPRIAERLRQDTEDVGTLQVRQTPTFFINGKPLRNFGPEGLASQIEEELLQAP